ncbi:unnamed protein product, partial [Timema podura]|nr:unnamed protein product [Timema podura]
MPAVITDVLGRNMYRVIFKEGLGKTRHIDQPRKRYEGTSQSENASERPISQVNPAIYQDKDLVTHQRARPVQQPLLTPQAREDYEQQSVEDPQPQEHQPTALIDNTGQQPAALMDNTGQQPATPESWPLLRPRRQLHTPVYLGDYVSISRRGGIPTASQENLKAPGIKPETSGSVASFDFTIMDTSSDLQTKYQKIASEYSKIRAQMAVLKTAVLEERSQNAELKDFVKSKDQGLRKAEQEMDSLNFRNQQLAKRVAFLQDELDAMQVKSKKGKSRGSSINNHEAEQANHVLDEEFRNKIEENARLLSLIQDKDMAHEQEVAALMQRLKRLEHEQQQQEQISQASEEKLKVRTVKKKI